MSTLWKGNHSSTGEFMADFYRRWAAKGSTVMKAEALRQAQLDLLHGQITPKPDPSDPQSPSTWAHPYYWAPFILSGNWK